MHETLWSCEGLLDVACFSVNQFSNITARSQQLSHTSRRRPPAGTFPIVGYAPNVVRATEAQHRWIAQAATGCVCARMTELSGGMSVNVRPVTSASAGTDLSAPIAERAVANSA